jgi:hypothetical protein
MFHSIRQQLREACTRALRSYEQKYGELHHRDPRTDEVTLVVFTREPPPGWPRCCLPAETKRDGTIGMSAADAVDDGRDGGGEAGCDAVMVTVSSRNGEPSVNGEGPSDQLLVNALRSCNARRRRNGFGTVADSTRSRFLRRRSRSAADLRKPVSLARARGRSWDHIGTVLHVSGDEAARRYGRRLPWPSFLWWVMQNHRGNAKTTPAGGPRGRSSRASLRHTPGGQLRRLSMGATRAVGIGCGMYSARRRAV